MALVNNILAYWKLDNNGSGGVSLVDSTPNGNTLISHNGGVNLGSGIIGGDAVGNGSGWLSTTNSLNFSGDFSINLWVKNNTGGQFFSGESGVGLGIFGDGSNVGFGLTGVYNIFYGGVPFVSGWNMISITRNSGTFTLYINGSFIKSASDSTDFTSNYALFAQANGGFVSNSNGQQVDEVGIWNRALTETEIYNLYYNGTGNTYPFNKPVIEIPLTFGCKAYWALDNNGSGGVSLVDSTGNGNTLTNNGGVTLGTGIVSDDANINSSKYLEIENITPYSNPVFSISVWANYGEQSTAIFCSKNNDIYQNFFLSSEGNVQFLNGENQQINFAPIYDAWTHYVVTYDSFGNAIIYQNGSVVGSANFSIIGSNPFDGLYLGKRSDGYNYTGQIDEVGIWNRALSQEEVTNLYNAGGGLTYPFNVLYYNNAQSDGDWGNLLNWWKDPAFTIQATVLPTSSVPVRIYGNVTQNTLGANQCNCLSATFFSSNFGAGLTLQTTGLYLNGTSIFYGTVSANTTVQQSAQLASASIVNGNVKMRNSSRAHGSIVGNATVYYANGNEQYPIGGTVSGSVTYLGWPSASPQWWNDSVEIGGSGNSDWNDLANWWSDNTYTNHPVNIVGISSLPDASTDVFIAPNKVLNTNSSGITPLINTITVNNSVLSINITVSNGAKFLNNGIFSFNYLYGNASFSSGAYCEQSYIYGTATYYDIRSIYQSWYFGSFGNLNDQTYGSTELIIDIKNKNKFISELLNLPLLLTR